MEDNKKILLSGKLSGTRTFTTELEKIENPDDVEKFLLEFSKLKFDLPTISSVQSIYDEQSLLNVLEKIENSSFISIYPTEDISKLYITIDSQEVFILYLQDIAPNIIANFISKEKPVKFALNAFYFIKWCNQNSIEIKNLLDIPTYIKLLTNDVDPFRNAESYINQYTDVVMSTKNDNVTLEKNSVLKSQFIYYFGTILANYIDKFDLTTVSKLINENSYYEGNSFNNYGNCKISLSYINIESAISNIITEVMQKYKDKAYIVSPLNRIAPTFKQDIEKLIRDVYSEDLSIAILNELYNNNIPVILDNNKYTINCKLKNFNNILSLVQAIFFDAFYTLFDQSPELYLESIIVQD